MSDEVFIDPFDDEEVILTDIQWQKVKDLWNSRPTSPPSLMELTQAAFDAPGLDGRTKEGRAVRKKLAEANLKAPTTGDKNLKIDLTDAQQEFVKNNCSTMSAYELAKVMFKNDKLPNRSAEARAVMDEVKRLKASDDSFVVVDDTVSDIERDYKPPRTLDRILAKINRYRSPQIIEKDKMTGRQKKEAQALIHYMNAYRFVHQMKTYERSGDRELFESEFVRCTYDKHDLTEEEVDQYIMYSTEVVIGASIQARVEKLRKMMDECTDDEDKKITMSLVGAIESAQTEYNQNQQRQNKLLSDLKVKRSQKEGRAKDGAASLLNLIALWKDETRRKEMIEIAEKRKGVLREEITRLTTMDEIKARIMGLTEGEVLN